MTRLLGLLCLLAPGLVLAQDAEETTAAEIRWLDRTTGRLETHLITVGFPLTLGGLDVHLQAFYNQLHIASRCHSLEVWQDHNLIGGVFGLTIGGVFFGESMFSKRDNGSKAALAFLTTHLQKCGFTLFDTQFITDHLASLGAVEITRAAYRRQLAQAIELPVSIISQPLPSVQDVLQRRTQTS